MHAAQASIITQFAPLLKAFGLWDYTQAVLPHIDYSCADVGPGEAKEYSLSMVVHFKPDHYKFFSCAAMGIDGHGLQDSVLETQWGNVRIVPVFADVGADEIVGDLLFENEDTSTVEMAVRCSVCDWGEGIITDPTVEREDNFVRVFKCRFEIPISEYFMQKNIAWFQTCTECADVLVLEDFWYKVYAMDCL